MLVTRDALFGNVGSVISFQVGPDDGEHLARQLGKYEDPNQSNSAIGSPNGRIGMGRPL